MISKNDFEKIKENIGKFKYNSMEYTEYKDIKNHEIIFNDENLLLLYGYSKETDVNSYNYAFNDHKDLINEMKKSQSGGLLTFVKKEWVNDLKRIGFDIYAIWCSYFSNSLAQFSYNKDIIFVAPDEYKEASAVTLSCRNQSRGFSGQSSDWIEMWVNNKVSEYAKDCNVIVKKVNNRIAGIVCVGIYGHESEKGPILWIRELAVSPDFQNMGIGRELLGQAFAYGLAKGATRSFLLADEYNYGAIHLYKSMGYEADENDREIDMIR